jgi:hypothetical protein
MTAGEQWASEQLLALRAARFRPRAWARFVSASLSRSHDTREARPRLARQARTWSAAGLVAGHGAAGALRAAGATAPRPGRWTAWWLATATMLDWHLGMLEGPDGEPRDRLTVADALTLVRVGLVPFIAATGPRSRCDGITFSALVTAAAVTDLLDGELARRTGPTRLGRDLDTAGDVAVKLAAARAARRAGWLGADSARLLTTCQVAGIAVVTASYFLTGHRPAATAPSVEHWSAPVLLGGLALAPHAPRPGGTLVTTASLMTLTDAITRRASAPIATTTGGDAPSPLDCWTSRINVAAFTTPRRTMVAVAERRGRGRRCGNAHRTRRAGAT